MLSEESASKVVKNHNVVEGAFAMNRTLAEPAAAPRDVLLWDWKGLEVALGGPSSQRFPAGADRREHNLMEQMQGYLDPDYKG